MSCSEMEPMPFIPISNQRLLNSTMNFALITDDKIKKTVLLFIVGIFLCAICSQCQSALTTIILQY